MPRRDPQPPEPRRAPLRLAWPAAAWHNIFYDLAFVAIVLVLSTSYSVDHSIAQSTWLVLAFFVLWLIWLVTSMVERTVRMGFWRVGLVAAQMAALLVAAISADATIDDTTFLFGVLIAGATLIILALDAVASEHILGWTDRALLAVAAIASGFGTTIESGWAFLLWVGSVVVLTIVAVRLVRNPRAAVGEHLQHRMGELTLIMIGESFVKVGLTANELSLTEYSGFGLLLVFGIVTTCWWAYFVVPTSAQVLPSGRPSTRWIAAHVPFHLAVVALAVGLGKLLTAGTKLDHGGLGALVLLPLALALLSVAAMVIRRAPARLPIALATGGALIAAIGLWADAVKEVDARGLTLVSFGIALAATIVMALRRGDAGGTTADHESEHEHHHA